MQYRYYITGRSGTRQVFPSNDGSLEFTFDKESGRSDFTRSLEGSITLKGKDFQWLYEMEKTVYRFDLLTINIHKYCEGAWNEDWFEGQVSLNGGEWNLDKCTVSIPVLKADHYECFDLNKDEVINLLNTVYPKVAVSAVAGRIERAGPFIVQFDGQGEDPFGNGLFPGEPNPASKGWQQESFRYEAPLGPNNPNGSQTIDGFATYTVSWVREVINGDDNLLPFGWISLGNGQYGRRAVLYDRRDDAYDRYRPNNYGYTWRVLESTIPNGFSLRRSFEILLGNVCPGLTLESDFFQWNPVNESDINYITGLPTRVNNLILFQKSGVKRPFATGQASIAEISLKDLLEDICNIFQLEWEITEDGKFKIEHVSYKNRHQGLDTTTGENKALNLAKRQYDYDNDGIPKREVFSWMDNAIGDFQATPILYTNAIAGREKDEEAYPVNNISTDVMYCLQNGDSENKNVSDDGFVLMACDINNSILRESPIRGGNDLNNSLSWAHLHRDYWRHDRYMLNFRMNNADTVALSVKPMKIQEQVKYRMCCASDFDKEGLITTALGDNGVLRSAKFNLFKERIEMVVAFPAEGTLEDNIPPVANDDEVDTFINTPVVVDVLANDTDEDGVIIPSTLNITSQFRGVAQLTEDFKVRFTPEQGFTGLAWFRYNVRDNLGETSNIAQARITVNPGTSVPVANGSVHVVVSGLELSKPAGSIQANDTAATALTVVADSGASEQGGTYAIASNGAFTYMAATDFVGTDTFPYTIRDNYGNEATGVTTIDVIAGAEVFVRLDIQQTADSGTITEPCGQHGEMSDVGNRVVSSITINFFADEDGTVPLDVTGYNMIVKLRRYYQDYINNINSDMTIDVSVTSGTSRVYSNGFTTYQMYHGCDRLTPSQWYLITFSLAENPSYTIIP